MKLAVALGSGEKVGVFVGVAGSGVAVRVGDAVLVSVNVGLDVKVALTVGLALWVAD